MSINPNAMTTGGMFLRTISITETPPMSAIAIMTPAIGEAVLPRLADNCIGRIIPIDETPTLEAMFGTSGPKEKKAAFPLPVIRAVMKIDEERITQIHRPETPSPVDNFMIPSTVPRLMSPFAKISAQTIKVMMLANVLPIPVQKDFRELNILPRLLVWHRSMNIAMNSETRTATVMSNSMDKPNMLPV